MSATRRTCADCGLTPRAGTYKIDGLRVCWEDYQRRRQAHKTDVQARKWGKDPRIGGARA